MWHRCGSSIMRRSLLKSLNCCIGAGPQSPAIALNSSSKEARPQASSVRSAEGPTGEKVEHMIKKAKSE